MNSIRLASNSALATSMREAGVNDVTHRSLALGTVAVLGGATPS